MILLEAQSLWTLNIIIRALLYLAQAYHDYFERTNQNLYKCKKSKNVLREYLLDKEKDSCSQILTSLKLYKQCDFGYNVIKDINSRKKERKWHYEFQRVCKKSYRPDTGK